MVSTARRVAERQGYVKDEYLYYARLHGGVQIAALSPTSYSRPAINVQVGESLGLNVIENMCSSAQAEVCQNKPKVTFATDAGDWNKQQEAEKLTKWLEGQFHETGFYEDAPKVFLDACIFGTGILKIYEDELNEKIAIERVFPWELFIDQAEGLYGRPRTIYQTKYVDKYVLMQTYPKLAKQIEKARDLPMGKGRDPFLWDTTAALVQVIEGWRLPSGKGTKDGRHVIAVDDVVLLDEPWDRDDLPFAFMRWLTRPFGFWGKGLCEQLAGIQKEINRLLIKIQRAFARLGITRIYVERGAKVNPSHLRANDGDIVEYTGSKPVTEAPPTVSPEIFSHLWQLESKAYQITGISQMTAQGQAPPPGVDSGRAIRTLLANHSKRLSQVADMYIQLAMSTGDKMISLATDIANREVDDGEENGNKKTKKRGYKVAWSDDSGTEVIDFAEVDLARDEYVMRPFPTSALPSNPGEKMQVVQEWFNTGMIDGDKAMMLMDFPDTKQFANMNPAIAMYRSVMQRLTDILKKGKPWVPDSFVEPSRAKALAVPFLLNAERLNAPADRLDLLRQTIEDLVANENKKAPAPPPGGGGPQLDQPPPGAETPQVQGMGPAPSPMSNPLQNAA